MDLIWVDLLFLGQGELRSGGSDRQSILSCTMEAIIGAIYLDGGFEATRTKCIEVVRTLFANHYPPLQV